MEHTPEPWKIGTPPPNGEQTIGDSTGMMVAVTTTGHGIDALSNARRIVACVNKFAGLSTEDVESIPVPVDRLARDYRKIRKQRDELLAALRDCVLVMERELEELKVIQPELNAARDAIASVNRPVHVPVADDECWIEWGGGECPVDGELLVMVKFECGDICGRYTKACQWDWSNGDKTGYKIIAYRVAHGCAA